MNKLRVPEPFSGGIFLTYKCTNNCVHCMYACSARWQADWLPQEDAEAILSQLAGMLRWKYPEYSDRIGVNYGIHFTGGEPFLNFDLLLAVTEMASRLGLPSTFVETNCFWCRDDEITREWMVKLRDAGLKGILISANPFVVEKTPFERTMRAARIGAEVFGGNLLIYQRFFYDQFQQMGLQSTLPFEEYLEVAGHGLRHAELLPNGRVPYKMAPLFERYPAEHFFGESCRHELVRDWHIHIDNYCNFVPGYCGGISLGDARELDRLCQGIDLAKRPVLKALLTSMKDLYDLGVECGYQDRGEYVSKCHLCSDVRTYLVEHGEFAELRPKEFYARLED